MLGFVVRCGDDSQRFLPFAASQPMIEIPSGASGISAVERSTRWAPESCHSMVDRASPGQGSPPGGIASSVHSPTSDASSFNAFSAVG